MTPKCLFQELQHSAVPLDPRNRVNLSYLKVALTRARVKLMIILVYFTLVINREHCIGCHYAA